MDGVGSRVKIFDGQLKYLRFGWKGFFRRVKDARRSSYIPDMCRNLNLLAASLGQVKIIQSSSSKRDVCRCGILTFSLVKGNSENRSAKKRCTSLGRNAL